MVYLDLDEIPEFFSRSPFWSFERFNWASFYRRDYFNPDVSDLKQAIADEIKHQTGETFSGEIRMLGHVRYFGLCFNPATFYFCFNQGQLEYVVTEVTNTPWNEKHCYVLKANELTGSTTTAKKFHVSPFLDMNMQYQWRINIPSETAVISITNFKDHTPVFNAKLKLERLEVTRRNLDTTLIRFPAVTLKMVTGIYWHALRLWLKGAKFYSHPNTSEDHRP